MTQGPVALSLWLRLLKVHGLVLREARRSVGPELTLPRFDVMAQLARSDEGLTFVDLSRRLLVTAGNLTGIVDRLVRDGLVARSTDRADRRARRLRLTPAGRRLMSRIMPRHARDIETLMQGTSPAELRALRVMLGRLAGDIERRSREETSEVP